MSWRLGGAEELWKVPVAPQQQGRGLGADAGDPGDAIGAVSHQRDQLTNLLGPHAPNLQDLVGARGLQAVLIHGHQTHLSNYFLNKKD